MFLDDYGVVVGVEWGRAGLHEGSFDFFFKYVNGNIRKVYENVKKNYEKS